MSEPTETAAPWPRGTTVSLSRLAGRGQAMAQALGIGELVDPVEVGCGLRVRLSSGRALAVSVVVRVEVVDDGTLRLETANHRYELRRVVGVPSAAGLPSVHDPTGRSVSAGSADPERTTVVTFAPETEARPGVFEEGARVSATRISDGESRELGTSVLLGDLAPGEPLRMSTPEGVIGTSPVTKIARVEDGAVEVSTSNSAYRLALVGETDGDAD